MPRDPLPHLLHFGRKIADPIVLVEFVGMQFGVEEVDAERLREALVWHFLPASQKFRTWLRNYLDETVTLRYRDGRVQTFSYGDLWRGVDTNAAEDRARPGWKPQST